MSRKVSLGVEPYEGKQPEDPFGPIDAIRRDNTPFEAPRSVPSPAAWVQFWVGARARELDSMRYHHRVDPAGVYVAQAAVLRRWLLNGDQALTTKAEVDLVLEALQRRPADPVDPAETPPVRAARDGELSLTRVRVTARRAQLP